MVDHELHPLTVIGIRQSNEQEPPLLVMRDDLGRNLEISIGLCEALAIQLALNKTVVGRPLTHDLILSLAEHLEAKITSVIIDDFSKGTFYARLVLETSEGEISLDCRPSDGIALAMRAEIPILAADVVMIGEEGQAEE